MTTRRHGWLAFVLILVVGSGVLALTGFAEPLPEPQPQVEASEIEPVGGSVVCPVGDGRSGTELQAIVSRPVGTRDVPAMTRFETYRDGEREIAELPPLPPGSSLHRAPSVGEDGALGLAWRAGPTVLHRDWTFEAEDLPSGIVAGGCPSALSQRWYIPGMVTSGGSQAILRVTNPYPSDATIALRFIGTDGPAAPIALRNLSVEGRTSLEIDINEYLPERDDLAAVVEVAAGRVAVQGLQLVRSEIGGIGGVSVLEAATEPSEIWTQPWVLDRDDATSWLWIYNPGDRVAAVELTYHTAEGGELPDGLSEVLVDPGQLRRVELRGTFPEDVQMVAVTARSDGAPIVVSNAVELTSADEDRTAFTVQLGVPASDTSWTISGGTTTNRVEALHLVNPGSEPADATVSLFVGLSLGDPEVLEGVTVPPGGRATVPVFDGESEHASWTALIDVSVGELVASRVGGSTEGPRRQVAVNGMPSASWTVISADQPVVRADSMVRRLRTARGIVAEEPVMPRPADNQDDDAQTPAPSERID